MLFSSIIQAGGAAAGAVYAAIIGSNLGALLTPIGALAGIMWESLIADRDVKFGYIDFIKYGAAVSIPTLFAALGGLQLAIAVF